MNKQNSMIKETECEYKGRKSPAYESTVREIKMYMADYSSTSSAPKAAKGGWYAVVTHKTGMVWLAQTKNFQTTLNRFRTTGATLAKELAALEGEGYSIFLTTKEFDVEELRFALEEKDRLLYPGTRVSDGPGKIYVVTHTSGHYYLSKARTTYMDADYILTRFLTRVVSLRQSNHYHTNAKLQQFVTENAGDVLRGTGFEVREVCDFINSDDAVEKMNEYYIDQSNLVCLNNVFDRR